MGPALKTTVLCILQLSVVISAQDCVWPDWFDVSKPDWSVKPEENSWETEARLDKELGSIMNWFIKSKKMVTVLNNNSLEISVYLRKSKANYTTYSCDTAYGNEKFLLMKTGQSDMSKIRTTYRCVQLIKKSRFVAQWRLGPESYESHECPDNFAGISDWPLIYFPIRETATHEKIFKSYDLLKDYPACPSLGGFLMKVYEEDGSHVQNQCKNEYPSSRIEMECGYGEGIRITTSTGRCGRYALGNRVGAQLNCLANWEDDNYRYSVLMPNDNMAINSFHCLRLDKNDPTVGTPIMFLDSVCLSTTPGGDMSYFRLQLRKHSVNSICDDLSDQCRDDLCPDMKYWCASSCSSCANVSNTVKSDEKIRGTWVLQRRGSKHEVTITENEFTLFDMGTFKAYGGLNNGTEVCLKPSQGMKNETFEYSLAKLGDGEGCGPRVSQLRASLISESVLLLQTTGTAPLRPDEYMTDVEKWCHNNYRDIDWYSPAFRPYWPYHSNAAKGAGHFTLIKKEEQTPVSCMLDQGLVTYAAHMKVNVSFSVNKKKYTCEGEAHVNGDEKYRLEYNCEDGKSDDVLFECLANYEVSPNYYGITLKAESSDAGSLISDRFYCLLIPVQNQEERLSLVLNTAGECDPNYISMAALNHRESVAKLYPLEFLSAAGMCHVNLWVVLGSLLYLFNMFL